MIIRCSIYSPSGDYDFSEIVSTLEEAEQIRSDYSEKYGIDFEIEVIDIETEVY